MGSLTTILVESNNFIKTSALRQKARRSRGQKTPPEVDVRDLEDVEYDNGDSVEDEDWVSEEEVIKSKGEKVTSSKKVQNSGNDSNV